MDDKVCSACGKSLSISMFSKDTSRKDGLNSKCKQCESEVLKEYNDFKKIMKRWSGTIDIIRLFTKSSQNILTRCGRCNNDKDMGHIVWYFLHGKYKNICRKCIVRMDQTDGDGLEEIMYSIDIELTEGMRNRLINQWRWDRMSDEDIEKAEKEYHKIKDKEAYKEWKKGMGC